VTGGLRAKVGSPSPGRPQPRDFHCDRL
jgi:hypothetical protein